MRRLIGGLGCVLGLACIAQAMAGELRLGGEATQGGLLTGEVTPGAEIRFDGRQVRVAADGSFVIGLGRDAPATVTLRIVWPDGAAEDREIEVAQREYEVQRIDGLPPRKVQPSEEDLERIRRESALMQEARMQDLAGSGFLGDFIWPVQGRISGVYGSQRILNGEPRRPHYGVDIAAPEGTPIVAPADGVVTLVHEGMFFNGKTVVLDHGHGLSSLFIHMSRIAVEEGQTLSRGERIGDVGTTGRSTGPHLHWGLSWFATRLDPALLTGPMPETATRAAR